jgi:alpha-tubulin suppressor-like RCC1 family protein
MAKFIHVVELLNGRQESSASEYTEVKIENTTFKDIFLFDNGNTSWYAAGAITTDGRIFVWGSNTSGKFALGTENLLNPGKITWSWGRLNSEKISISADGNTITIQNADDYVNGTYTKTTPPDPSSQKLYFKRDLDSDTSPNIYANNDSIPTWYVQYYSEYEYFETYDQGNGNPTASQTYPVESQCVDKSKRFKQACFTAYSLIAIAEDGTLWSAGANDRRTKPDMDLIIVRNMY